MEWKLDNRHSVCGTDNKWIYGCIGHIEFNIYLLWYEVRSYVLCYMVSAFWRKGIWHLIGFYKGNLMHEKL